jgi:hypothetical protein
MLKLCRAAALGALIAATGACNGTPDIRLVEPGAMPIAGTGQTPTPAPPPLRQGDFRNGFHRVTGKASLQSEGSGYGLRLTDFTTENGPDLYVYLVRNDDGSPANDGSDLELGRLKSTNGSFSYTLPASADPARFRAVTIWCRAFRVNFGYAPLP